MNLNSIKKIARDYGYTNDKHPKHKIGKKRTINCVGCKATITFNVNKNTTRKPHINNCKNKRFNLIELWGFEYK